MKSPLAAAYRPTNFDEVVGQTHLIGKNGVIRKMIDNNALSNMILYGPSGTGKTTIASIIASLTNKKLYKLNATTASTKDIKDIINDLSSSQSKILLYLDEIQYFSKKQQQSLLEVIENGDITLIASTTENPYFYIYNAILSRSTIFEFHPLSNKDIEKALTRVIKQIENDDNCRIEIDNECISYLASSAGGDARKALNALEVALNSSSFYDQTYHISIDILKSLSLSPVHYDKDGDDHYDLLSAFQKSIRGSDADAGIFYLAKLLASKDLISPCRRLLVIASEDIGLANPQAAVIVKNLVDSAFQLGLPEARIPLAEAVIFLCLCPKSNSAITAIDQAMDDISKGRGKEIPAYLKDGHYQGAVKLNHAQGYIYPHTFPHHYVQQQYLPDDLKERVYYLPGENKIELSYKEYWDKIKKN